MVSGVSSRGARAMESRAAGGVIRLCIVSLFALASSAAAQAEANFGPGIVGTWQLVEFEDVEDGRIVHAFGPRPLGLFIYTADGHVAIQIANPANPSCVAPSKASRPGRTDDRLRPTCTAEQMQALVDGSVAYWGTYTVDAEAGTVVHHVTSDLSNGYAGSDQSRPFRLDGDRLVIGDGKTWTRVLKRLR